MSNKLEILKVRGQNFLSIGPAVEFDFEKHRGLNYIYGQNNDIKTKKKEGESDEQIRNGSGKSTIFIDLVCSALFDKLPRGINKPNIPNRRFKKNCVVELWMRANDKFYYIRNQLSAPVMYELYESDDPIGDDYSEATNITKSSPRETIAFVRQNIIKSSYKIFINTNILSVTDHSSIYALSKNEKRKLIEQLFSVTLFGEVQNIIKTEALQIEKLAIQGRQAVMTLKDRIEDLEKRHLNFEQEKQKRLNDLLDLVESKEAQINLLKQSLLKKDIVANEIAVLEQEIKDLHAEQADLNSLNSSVLSNKSIISAQHAKVSTMINTYDVAFRTVCQSCIPRLQNALDMDIDKLKATLENVTKQLVEVDAQIHDNSKMIAESIADCKAANNKLLALQIAMRDMNRNINDIARIDAELSALDISIAEEETRKSQFAELAEKDRKDFNGVTNELEVHEERIKYLDALKHVYSEQGVKNFVIGPLVKTLNNMIQSYLIQMGSEYTVMIDAAFNFKFITVSGDCEYGNFSAGERRRIDIATILALRDLLMMRGLLECNILICDEILDVSIDNFCMNVLLEKLKSISEKQNVFLISHREFAESSDMFDCIVRIDKTGGCTHIGLDTSVA